MKQLLLVFLGGGLGSTLRHLISVKFNPFFHNFYLGTFLVNIIGCLFIGIIMGLSLKGSFLNQNTVLLFATGFCGGFTTFSAFAFEKYLLVKSGDFSSLLLYFFASILVGFLAVILGVFVSKQL